ILFQGNTSANVSATVSNGVGTLTFQARKAFTDGSNNRQLQVYINNNLDFTTPTFGTASTDTTIHTFTVENINVTGDVAIRIQNATGNQVTIDNIAWTCYSEEPTPALSVSFSQEDLHIEHNINATTPTVAEAIVNIANLTEEFNLSVVSTTEDFVVNTTGE